MFQKIKNFRIKIILIAVTIISLIILIRIFYLQVFAYSKLNNLATSLWQRNLPVTAERGEILDRNGKVLAMNITTTTIYVVPNQINNKEEAAKKLADILQADYNAILAHLKKRTYLGSFIFFKITIFLTLYLGFLFFYFLFSIFNRFITFLLKRF